MCTSQLVFVLISSGLCTFSFTLFHKNKYTPQNISIITVLYNDSHRIIVHSEIFFNV